LPSSTRKVRIVRASQSAYRARAELNRTLAQFRSAPAPTFRTRLALEYMDVPTQQAIARLVTTGEVYVSERLRATSITFVGDHGFARLLWEEQDIRATRTWGDRTAAWSRLHSIPLAKAPEYEAVRKWVLLRNRLVHELGLVWPNRPPEVADLVSLGCTTRSGGIHVPREGVELCARTIWSLVEWLDAKSDLRLRQALPPEPLRLA
jgi:hypothetical protein